MGSILSEEEGGLEGGSEVKWIQIKILRKQSLFSGINLERI